MDLFNKDKLPVSENIVDDQTSETEEEVIESEPSDFVGCAHCNNTGLEPGMGLDVATVCTVCGGSPFGV